jgi:YfiH family protein
MTLPSVPDTFHWTLETWGPALRCRPFGEAAHHLFTTRQLELPAPLSWERLGPALGVASSRFVTLNQVHGCRVIAVHRGLDEASLTALQVTRPDADAIISDDQSVGLVVRAADCVPLLIADRRRGAVGAVHAGWRGTAARVASAAVHALEREFGSRPDDLMAVIGPAIGACCYEVGSDVVDAFAAAGHERHLIDRWFLSPPADRRLRLDVPGANRDQLILAGVPEEQIYVAGLCTAMHLDVLTSYRAEKEGAGRIAGVIRASRVPS